MNNSDMPANPIANDKGCPTSTKNGCDRVDDGFVENFGSMIGLTKREHFAAMAISSVLDKYNPYESGEFDSSDWDCVAKNAVGIADALLKELANNEAI